MNMTKQQGVKQRIRKAVDISSDLQKSLSYQAIEQGMSLKKYMEWSLEQVAMLREEDALIEAIKECDPADTMTENEKQHFVNRLITAV